MSATSSAVQPPSARAPRRAASAPARASAFAAAGMLAWRELVRFFRQRNRVVGAVGQPVLFWLLFGAGLHRSFQLGDAAQGAAGTTFLEYYFPGTLVLIVLFTAIFATISIIEDRREGLLQGVLIAPCPRWSIVLGKVGGGTAIALIQGLIFLGLALLFQISLGIVAVLGLIGLLIVVGVGLTSLGTVLAWRMDSTQGFHAVMSVLLLPLWLLSGAFFPVPAWSADATRGETILHVAMRLDPLTYAIAAARGLVSSAPLPAAFWSPGASVSWLVTLGFAAAMFALACVVARARTQGDAQ